MEGDCGGCITARIRDSLTQHVFTLLGLLLPLSQGEERVWETEAGTTFNTATHTMNNHQKHEQTVP